MSKIGALRRCRRGIGEMKISRLPHALAMAVSPAFAANTIAAPATAQGLRCDTFGDFTSCTGPGGYTSRQETLGDVITGADSRGSTWRTSRFGDTTTTQVTPGS
jgi:hypothetical protein